MIHNITYKARQKPRRGHATKLPANVKFRLYIGVEVRKGKNLQNWAELQPCGYGLEEY